jgi:hypothetical protein
MSSSHFWMHCVSVAAAKGRWHKRFYRNAWEPCVQRDDPNLEYLLVVASALGDLCNEIVFVGGSVAGLLLARGSC